MAAYKSYSIHFVKSLTICVKNKIFNFIRKNEALKWFTICLISFQNFNLVVFQNHVKTFS